MKSFDSYYIQAFEDGSWNEVYDPHVATVFISEKAAEDFANNKTDFSEYITLISGSDNIFAEYNIFDEWVANGMIRRHFEAMNPTYNVMYDPEKHDCMDVLKWNYQFAIKGDDMMIHQEVYNSWCSRIWDHFNFINDFNSYCSGDYTEKFVSFEIKVDRNAKLEDFKKELDLVLDNFEFNYVDKDGGLIISIFEHDLCETRSMVLIMNDRENDEWSIENERCGSASPVINRESLEKCFKKIRKKYWYYSYS